VSLCDPLVNFWCDDHCFCHKLLNSVVRVFVQRRNDSDCETDDRKKQRTAEAGDAGQVMGDDGAALSTNECSNGTVTDECCQQKKTADTEDVSSMSVDVVVDENIPVVSVSSDNISMTVNLPSDAAQSISRTSSVTDVIDVDVLDSEASCDRDNGNKSISYSKPEELGLNEYYLQPGRDEPPAENVIDVDAETAEAEGSSVDVLDAAAAADSINAVVAENEVSLEHSEGKPCANETHPVDAEVAATSTDSKSEAVPEVEVQSTELVATSPPSTPCGNQTSPTNVTSVQTDSVSEKPADDSPAGDTCGDIGTEQEVASYVECQDRSSTEADIGEMVTEMVDSVVASSMDKDAVIVVEELADIPQGEDATDGDMGRPQVAVEQEVEVLTVSDTLPRENTPGVSDVEKTIAEPVDVDTHGEDEMLVAAAGTGETDAVKASDEENTAQQNSESSVDATGGKASSYSESPAELMEVKDTPVSGDDKTPSDGAELMELTDNPVSDADNITLPLTPVNTAVAEESAEVTISAVSGTENIQQHPEQVENMVISDDVEPDAHEIPQNETEVNEASEAMEKADISLGEDVTDETVIGETEIAVDFPPSKELTDAAVNDNIEVIVKSVTDKEHVSQDKDVSEHCEEPVEMTLESVDGEEVSQSGEKTKDMSEATEEIVTTGEISTHLTEVKDVPVIDDQPLTEVTDNMQGTKSDSEERYDQTDMAECEEEVAVLKADDCKDTAESMDEQIAEVTDKVDTEAQSLDEPEMTASGPDAE